MLKTIGVRNTALKGNFNVADAKARGRAKALDSFQNFAAKLGMGTGNQMSNSTYGYNPITRVRTLLEWIHRGSWIGGMAVDVIADDATRAGVTIRGDIKSEDVKKVEDVMTRLNVWGAMNETIKWGRLYGGAIGVILIDGQDMETPLNEDSIAKGAFRGVLPLDRWMVDVFSTSEVVTELGPDLGKPMYYRIVASPALRGMRIHYSRLFRAEGTQLTYWQRMSENGWSASVLERLYDRMIAFDSATTGAAQLVYKSYLRTIKMNGLRDVIAQGGDMLEGVVKYIDMMARFQSIEGITLLDGEDEFDVATAPSFSGLNDALVQFGQQLAGATGIPLVRLFGQSPAGLNSTGESDLRLYYDNILQFQKRTLHVPVNKVYRCAAISEGIKINESFEAEFTPLWQLEETDKIDIATKAATMVADLVDRGIYTPEMAVRDLQSNNSVTGYFENIDDAYVASLADLGPPMPTEVRTAQERNTGQESVAKLRNEEAPDEEDDKPTGPVM